MGSVKSFHIPVNVLLSLGSVAGVVAFHEAGHFLAAKWQGMKIDSYNIGYGPKLVSFNDSTNTEFALRLVPLGGYVAFPTNVEYDEETGEVVRTLEDPDLIQNRPPLQRAVVISAGVLANVLLSFLICTGVSLSTGIGTPVYTQGVVVSQIYDTNSPAYRSGLRVSDIITQINHCAIEASETAVEQFVTTVRQSESKPLDLQIRRYSNPLAMSGEQLIDVQVTAEPNSKGKMSIGVGINAMVKEVKNIKASNPIEAVRIGAQQTVKLIFFTWNAFTRAISTGFSGNEVGGPIAVVKAGAQMAEYSPSALIGFIASLSINLAVLNSLPFPALDGGQLTFVMIETLLGRPIPRRIQDSITAVAFSVILVFGVGTIIGDIDRLMDSIPTINAVQLDNTMMPP